MAETLHRISATPQLAWNEAHSVAVDDRIAFSRWHALAAHHPIGSIDGRQRLPDTEFPCNDHHFQAALV